MAQHDMVVDNQGASSARSDLNDLFAALVSQNSGATSPLVTYANMVWVDTAANLLKVRNEAGSAWITVGAFDQTNGRYEFRGNVIQAITTAGLTFKASGGGTILAVSNTGAITTSGNIDGRSISTDGSKLDGIEAGATVDQSAAEILTAIKTVDGAGSGLDADVLDAQSGSYYLDYNNFTNTPAAGADNATHQETILSSTTSYVGGAGTLHVMVLGGGGGGACSQKDSDANTRATGGGAGGSAYKAYTVSAGTAVTCTVGAGGFTKASNLGPIAAFSGTAGGTTSVTIGGVTVSATGGGAGLENSTAAVSGGTGSGGDINWTGGSSGGLAGSSFAEASGGGSPTFGIGAHTGNGSSSNSSENTSVETVAGGPASAGLPQPFLAVTPAAHADGIAGGASYQEHFGFNMKGGLGYCMDNPSSSSANITTLDQVGWGCGAGGYSGRAEDSFSPAGVIFSARAQGGNGFIILVMEYSV